MTKLDLDTIAGRAREAKDLAEKRKRLSNIMLRIEPALPPPQGRASLHGYFSKGELLGIAEAMGATDIPVLAADVLALVERVRELEARISDYGEALKNERCVSAHIGDENARLREEVERLRETVRKESLHTPAAVVQAMPKLEWRKNEFGKDGRWAFVGGLYVGQVHQQRSGKWRSWIMANDEGEEVGMHDTVDDARAAIEAAVKERLGWKD